MVSLFTSIVYIPIILRKIHIHWVKCVFNFIQFNDLSLYTCTFIENLITALFGLYLRISWTKRSQGWALELHLLTIVKQLIVNDTLYTVDDKSSLFYARNKSKAVNQCRMAKTLNGAKPINSNWKAWEERIWNPTTVYNIFCLVIFSLTSNRRTGDRWERHQRLQRRKGRRRYAYS